MLQNKNILLYLKIDIFFEKKFINGNACAV